MSTCIIVARDPRTGSEELLQVPMGIVNGRAAFLIEWGSRRLARSQARDFRSLRARVLDVQDFGRAPAGGRE